MINSWVFRSDTPEAVRPWPASVAHTGVMNTTTAKCVGHIDRRVVLSNSFRCIFHSNSATTALNPRSDTGSFPLVTGLRNRIAS